jgi:hypothetical protein
MWDIMHLQCLGHDCRHANPCQPTRLLLWANTTSRANGSIVCKLIPATKCVLIVVLISHCGMISIIWAFGSVPSDLTGLPFARCFQSPFIHHRDIPRYILRKCDTAFCDQIGLACSPEVPATNSITQEAKVIKIVHPSLDSNLSMVQVHKYHNYMVLIAFSCWTVRYHATRVVWRMWHLSQHLLCICIISRHFCNWDDVGTYFLFGETYTVCFENENCKCRDHNMRVSLQSRVQSLAYLGLSWYASADPAKPTRTGFQTDYLLHLLQWVRKAQICQQSWCGGSCEPHFKWQSWFECVGLPVLSSNTRLSAWTKAIKTT